MEVYLPPKSLLCSLVLALAPGRLRIRFLLFKSPSSSFIHMSDQGQGSLGAGFRSDPRLLYLDQTLVKSKPILSARKKKKNQGDEEIQYNASQILLRRLNTWCTLGNMREESSILLICLAITERISV